MFYLLRIKIGLSVIISLCILFIFLDSLFPPWYHCLVRNNRKYSHSSGVCTSCCFLLSSFYINCLGKTTLPSASESTSSKNPQKPINGISSMCRQKKFFFCHGHATLEPVSDHFFNQFFLLLDSSSDSEPTRPSFFKFWSLFVLKASFPVSPVASKYIFDSLEGRQPLPVVDLVPWSCSYLDHPVFVNFWRLYWPSSDNFADLSSPSKQLSALWSCPATFQSPNLFA